MYIRPQRSDELYHWVTPEKHKYIAKIGEGKDARYFYTQEELAAYKQMTNNKSQQEKEVGIERSQRARDGYRGKNKSMGEVRFANGEQRGMSKEDREEHKKYLNSDEVKKELHDYHAGEEKWYKKNKKEADDIAARREQAARERYGHTQQEMNARQKEARLEERDPRVVKVRGQDASDTRKEQMMERRHESKASKDQVKEGRLNENGPRVAKVKGQDSRDARKEQMLERRRESNKPSKERSKEAALEERTSKFIEKRLNKPKKKNAKQLTK